MYHDQRIIFWILYQQFATACLNISTSQCRSFIKRSLLLDALRSNLFISKVTYLHSHIREIYFTQLLDVISVYSVFTVRPFTIQTGYHIQAILQLTEPQVVPCLIFVHGLRYLLRSTLVASFSL